MSKSDELERLKAEHIKANDRAADVLRKFGVDSQQFADADKLAAEITTRIETLERTMKGVR